MSALRCLVKLVFYLALTFRFSFNVTTSIEMLLSELPVIMIRQITKFLSLEDVLALYLTCPALQDKLDPQGKLEEQFTQSKSRHIVVSDRVAQGVVTLSLSITWLVSNYHSVEFSHCLEKSKFRRTILRYFCEALEKKPIVEIKLRTIVFATFSLEDTSVLAQFQRVFSNLRSLSVFLHESSLSAVLPALLVIIAHKWISSSPSHCHQCRGRLDLVVLLYGSNVVGRVAGSGLSPFTRYALRRSVCVLRDKINLRSASVLVRPDQPGPPEYGLHLLKAETDRWHSRDLCGRFTAEWANLVNSLAISSEDQECFEEVLKRRTTPGVSWEFPCFPVVDIEVRYLHNHLAF